jgi:hypothetical protein
MMPTLIAAFVSLICLAPVPTPREPAGGKAVVPKLDPADREAIVAGAVLAIREYHKAGVKGDIPAGLWGAAIAKLKPIRVRYDRVNVAIVLSEKDGVEEGLYMIPFISSYAISAAEFVTFERLSGPGERGLGVLYRYKLAPKAK